MYRDIATTLYKRGEASMDGYQMPGWAWAVFALNAIVFVPLFLIVCISTPQHETIPPWGHPSHHDG